MRSYKVELPRGIEVDIFNLPEDFEGRVKQAFREYTAETAKDYRDCGKLGFIDCCVRHINGDKYSYDVVDEKVKSFISSQWEEYGQLDNKDDVYSVDFMLRKCSSLRDKALLEFLYSTAVRVSELVEINREDIRYANKELIVYGKGAKERTVYINERTNMYLKEYLESRKDNDPALFVGSKKPNSRLTKTGIEDIIRRIGEKAGVENAHPHRFRRTALTNALNRGMPLQEAMIFAGHAKSETTMRYCTVNQEGVRYHHFKYLSA